MRFPTALLTSESFRKISFVALFLGVLLLYLQYGENEPFQDEAGLLTSYVRLFLPLLPSHSRTTVQDELLGDFPLLSSGQSYTFRPGDSFSGVLLGLGVSSHEIQAIVRSVRKATNLALVVPGRQMHLLVDQTSGLVQLMEYEVGELKRLKIAREGNRFRISSEPIPLKTEVRFAEGTVAESFYQSAARAHVPQELISSFADLFAWDIDFSQEISSGDRFRMVYEAYLREGGVYHASRIIAGEIVHSGRRLQAFSFAQNGEEPNYFDAQGRPVKKAFLRSPLRYLYVSSGFSESRLHPVLQIYRRHLGIDYAAPAGTPVMAASNGVVRFRGWKGGYGNCVVLGHFGGYSTLYGHLMGFAPGLRVGQRVQQKEVIGYVGSTGISTGPHLHYTFMRDGVPINPVQAEQVQAEDLFGRELDLFRSQIAPFQRWMETSTPNAA